MFHNLYKWFLISLLGLPKIGIGKFFHGILTGNTPSNYLAKVSVKKLRTLGWYRDGSLHNVNLRRAQLNTLDLSRFDLQNSDLSYASMYATNLSGAILRGALLESAILIEAKLANAQLDSASLQRSYCVLSDLVRCNLKKANLTNGIFSDCRLQKCNFHDAIAIKCNFGGSDLRNAELDTAILDGAILDQTNLKDSTITEKQLGNVETLYWATMPDGSRYDGRYNLKSDLIHARAMGVDIHNEYELRKFYLEGTPEIYADERR